GLRPGPARHSEDRGERHRSNRLHGDRVGRRTISLRMAAPRVVVARRYRPPGPPGCRSSTRSLRRSPQVSLHSRMLGHRIMELPQLGNMHDVSRRDDGPLGNLARIGVTKQSVSRSSLWRSIAMLNLTLWIVQIFLALFFIGAAIPKI